MVRGTSEICAPKEGHRLAGLSILVIGMHRAGTSLITRSLSCLGVELGSHLMPAASHNSMGYFEDTRVVELNERLLSKAGRRWTDISPPPADFFSDQITEEDRHNAREIIRSFSADVFALKDPRLSLTAPFWLQALEDSNREVKVIICLRHPGEVARSLNRRDLTPLAKGAMIWLHYMLSAAHFSRHLKPLVVSYERMCRDAPKEILRIRDEFDLQTAVGVDVQIEAFAREFVQLNLRHERDRSLPEAPRAVLRLYEILEQTSASDRAALTGFQQDIDALRDWFDDISGLRGFADSVEKMFTDKSAEYDLLRR